MAPAADSNSNSLLEVLSGLGFAPWNDFATDVFVYERPATGRSDGENYQIGFVDVCGRPYGPLLGAARASHEQLYEVALGQVPPYDDAPQYLPLLFV